MPIHKVKVINYLKLRNKIVSLILKLFEWLILLMISIVWEMNVILNCETLHDFIMYS
jgi:hypothetical protein